MRLNLHIECDTPEELMEAVAALSGLSATVTATGGKTTETTATATTKDADTGAEDEEARKKALAKKKRDAARLKAKKDAEAEAKRAAEAFGDEEDEDTNAEEVDLGALLKATVKKLSSLYVDGDNVTTKAIVGLLEHYGVKRFSDLGEDKATELAAKADEIEESHHERQG